MLRKIAGLTLLIFMGMPFLTQAQSTNGIIDLPRVIPPPSDAGSLGQYGAVPVSMYTGSPNISVPLYTIQTPRLSLPVSLNYNATGIKVDDLASWVGLEWSLNAGGVITRTIRGIDDFGGNGYYSTNVPYADSVTPQTCWGFFGNDIKHVQDADPDYFFFNFGPYSGKFFFGQNKLPVIVNYQEPLSIQYNSGNGDFIIQNEKGDTYYFNAQEAGTTSGDYNGYATAPPYVSSWYLSKVVSFDRSDSITFSYTGDVVLEQDLMSYTESIGPYYSNGTYNVQGHFYSTGEPFNKSAPLRLNEIDYKNGKILFYGSATRLDQAGMKLDSVIAYAYNFAQAQYTPIKKAVLSYDYYVTTSAAGTQPAICHSGDRLRLDSVGLYGAGGTFGGEFRFSYDPNMLPWTGSNARDLFGYYNGATGNTSLVPTQNVTYATTQYTVGAANRATDTATLHYGILKKVTYPTGGCTSFAYEPNSYVGGVAMTTITALGANAFGVTQQNDTSAIFTPSGPGSVFAQIVVNISAYNYPGVTTRPFVEILDLTTGQTVYFSGYANPSTGTSSTAGLSLAAGHNYESIAGAFGDGRISASIYATWQVIDYPVSTVVYGGGLRILQTTDYDNTGRFLGSDLYRYGLGESGYGILSAPVMQFNTNSYFPNYIYSNAASNTVVQQREVFTAGTVYDCFTLSGAPVSYLQVDKYAVDSLNNNIGKSVFHYNYFGDTTLSVPYAYFGGLYLANTGWAGGQLLLEEDYANKNGVFWPVKRTYDSYLNPPLAQGRGLQLGYLYIYQGTPPLDSTDVVSNFDQYYYWFDYPVYSGSVLPATTTVYDYDQNDTTKYVTSTRQMQYDNLTHLQPTTITRNLSDGSTLQTVNRYPAEVDSITGLSPGEIAAIDSLQSRHDLTELIQSQTTRNGVPVSLLRHDFAVWPNNMILQDSIEWQESTFPIDKRIQFFQYDANGNILQEAKALGMNYSYLWDYTHSYPIAEASNAVPSDIAYTSFEADGGGTWTIPSTARNAASALTGTMSYSLSNGRLSKAGLNATTNYVVSYWSENGAYTVTGSTGVVTGKTININGGTWTYFEHTVSGVVTVGVSGTGVIDELRLYPATAQMKTYTYSPLIGMTNQCDVDNRVTYYAYDGIGRLMYIRDQDGNIIKTYQYHYLGQPTQY